jgi:hypothetical protein
MLSAAGAVLQDLGFTLDETDATLGILVASKWRDATSSSQVTAAFFHWLFTRENKPIDRDQKIWVTMVVREIAPASVHAAEAKSSGQAVVRVTFQRVIYNTNDDVTLREQINDPAIYRAFFDKLSHAVFLEAHEI